MLTARLYMLQRLTALVMVPFVLGHLAVMIYAVQGGLSGEEILARTRGNGLWFWFYAAFVAAVSVHAAIGVRVIAYEWFGVREKYLEAVMTGFGGLLFAMGLTAILAVTMP